MTSSTYRPSPHTNTHRVQIILIICHLRIRSAFPRCHLHYQPAAAAAAASEYTGRSRDVEVTSIRMRLLASSYNRYGLSVESGGLDVTQTYLCGRRLRSNNLSLRNLLRNKAPTRPSSEEGKKKPKSNVAGGFLSFTLLTAPPACHLSTLTSFESQTAMVYVCMCNLWHPIIYTTHSALCFLWQRSQRGKYEHWRKRRKCKEVNDGFMYTMRFDA